MTRARNSANLASHGNLFVDIANDRTGIGSVVPAQNLHVAGTAGFHADVTFTGDLYNTTWDRSANSLSFQDSAKIRLGTDNDASIRHDGSNMWIQNSTGYIYMDTASTAIRLISQASWASGAMAAFNNNGSVQLFYDAQQRFLTQDYGINVIGTTDTDGLVVSGVATVTTMNVTGVLTYDDVTSVDSVGIVTARQGVHIDDSITHIGDTDTKIRFPSNDAIQFETGGSNRLSIDSSGNVTIAGNLTVSGTTTQNNTVATSTKVFTLASGAANNAAVDGAGILIDAGSDTDKTLKWLDSTDRWTFTGGDVSANAYYGNGSNLTGIDTDLVSDTSPQLGGDLQSNGNDIDFADGDKAVFGTGSDFSIYHDGTNSIQFFDSQVGAVRFRTDIGNSARTALQLSAGVNLYYNNDLRFNTHTNGFEGYGGSFTFYGQEGGGSQLLIYADEGDDLNDRWRIMAGGSNDFEIGNLADGSWDTNIKTFGDGAVELYYNNARQLQTLSNGIKPDNNLFMNDNKPIYIGNNLDLQLYHDGSNSFIKDGIGSSGLVVQTPLFAVKSEDGSENMIVATQNNTVELMYDNTRMLRTYSGGVKVSTNSSHGRLVFEDTDGNFCWQLAGFDAVSSGTGGRGLFQDATGASVLDMRGSGTNIHSYNTIKLNAAGTADGLKLTLGASDDLQLYHNGSNSAVQNYQGALYISNKETNSSDLHLQGKTSIQMHCPSDGTIVQKIDNNRLTTFDVGAPSSSNKTIARFQSESSRKLDVVWHDSGSYMGFDTPGNHPYMFKVNGTSALEINTYRETKTEESSHGWSTYEMHAKDGGTRFHYRGIGAGSSGTTINLIRVRRHYWGSGWYHIKLRQRYYNGSAEGHWWLHGHGRNTGGHSPSWQLNHTNHNNLGGSKVQITSNSNSSPGNDYSGYVDVYANIGAYEYYEVVIETSLMSGYNHGVANVGNDSYALHAF